MSVVIGNAKISENGTINGAVGDQTTNEVALQNFYVHSKGWVVLRATSTATAKKIAECMITACANQNFGYGQNDRLTSYNESAKYKFDCSKVNVKVNTDCSELVRICVAYAGITTPDFYTGNEKSVLLKTGKFNEVNFTDESCLKVGDILITKTKGHSAIVVTVSQSASTTKNGWEEKNGSWYYYRDGKMLKKEWVESNNHWYRLGNDGKMLIGWHLVPDKDGKNRMCYFEEKDKKILGAQWHEASDKCGYLEVWTTK